jgi:hypothetical protein
VAEAAARSMLVNFFFRASIMVLASTDITSGLISDSISEHFPIFYSLTSLNSDFKPLTTCIMLPSFFTNLTFKEF